MKHAARGPLCWGLALVLSLGLAGPAAWADSAAPAAESGGAAAAGAQVLAPSGTLLVGVYRGSPTSIIEGATPEQSKGVGFDLGRDLAKALGVPFKAVVFPANAPLLAALKAGKVDIVFTNATPARAQTMDFAPTFMAVEKSFLVAGDSRLKSVDAVKGQALTVGVSKGSSTARELAEVYPDLKLVEVDTLAHAGQMLSAHQIDAFATNDAILYQMSDGIAGSRVLPGHWGMEHFAAGIPKGRATAMPVLTAFMAKASKDGQVAKAIARAGLRGVVPEAAGQ